MIHQIYILKSDSGVPLLTVNFHSTGENEKNDSVLFTGVLQSIRMFLKECKIGDLSNFTTNDKQIEISYLKQITVAVIADNQSPSKDILADITSDVAALFISIFRLKLENFNGDVAQFAEFEQNLIEFVNLKIEQFAEEYESEMITKIPSGLLNSSEITPDSDNIQDWLKNRFGTKAKIEKNKYMKIYSENLFIDYILDCGERILNKLNSFVLNRILKQKCKNLIFVKKLDATHGPAQIRDILEKISKLGDSNATKDEIPYNWLPTEIVFIGPTVDFNTFNELTGIIKKYKGIHLIAVEYVGTYHREKSPHHSFQRCRVSAWRWNQKVLSATNIPKKFFQYKNKILL